MTTVTLCSPAPEGMIANLADAAKRCTDSGAVSSICTVVANLIACSGSFGGTNQHKLMDAATRCGFSTEFCAGQSIRVSWP